MASMETVCQYFSCNIHKHVLRITVILSDGTDRAMMYNFVHAVYSYNYKLVLCLVYTTALK